MKKSMKFATALAGAAVVVVGGTAFTANISNMQENVFAGSENTTVSGVTLTHQEYTYAVADGKLDKVVFKTSNTVMNADNTITSTLTATAADDQTKTCTSDEGVATSIITCDYSTNVDPEDVTDISLKVLPKST